MALNLKMKVYLNALNKVISQIKLWQNSKYKKYTVATNLNRKDMNLITLRYNRIYSRSVILSLEESTLVDSFLDVTHHIEGGLWEVVALTGEKLTETID